MSNSDILAVPEIAPDQANKYITHNNAVTFLEQAANATYINSSVGGSTLAINEANFTRNVAFRLSGASANIDVTFPSTVDGNNTKRMFAVDNRDGTYTMTVKASSGAGASVSVPAGAAVLVYQTFEDIYKLSETTPPLVAAIPYDVGVFIPGQPGDNAVVATLVFARACTMADDFAGSFGHVGTNPTSTAVFDIAKNGSSVGSASINTAGSFTFSTTGGATTFAAGDRLTITAPTPQDATLADIAITLKATRTGV